MQGSINKKSIKRAHRSMQLFIVPLFVFVGCVYVLCSGVCVALLLFFLSSAQHKKHKPTTTTKQTKHTKHGVLVVCVFVCLVVCLYSTQNKNTNNPQKRHKAIRTSTCIRICVF